MNRIKALVFDYGGTLDTGGSHWGNVLWHAYERQHIPISKDDFRSAYSNVERLLGREHIIQADFTFRQTLETKVGLQMQQLGISNSLANIVVDDVYRQTRHHTSHSVQVLKQLYTHYPLLLVSNFYGNLQVVLREFGFNGLFQRVVESAAVGIRKPDVRIFQLAIGPYGVHPDEVVVIGDSVKNDILPALQMGCHTIWYKGEQWGDDASVQMLPSSQTSMSERVSDAVITDLSALPHLLL